MFCLDGITLKVYNTQVNSSLSTFSAYPALAVDLLPSVTGNLVKTYAADSETALEFTVNNTDQFIQKSYPIRHPIQLSGGYPVGGRDFYFVPGTYGANNGLYLVIGYKTQPTNSATQILQVAEVEVTAHMRFARPMRSV